MFINYFLLVCFETAEVDLEYVIVAQVGLKLLIFLFYLPDCWKQVPPCPVWTAFLFIRSFCLFVYCFVVFEAQGHLPLYYNLGTITTGQANYKFYQLLGGKRWRREIVTY